MDYGIFLRSPRFLQEEFELDESDRTSHGQCEVLMAPTIASTFRPTSARAGLNLRRAP
jgi:hypothetical protein